MTTERLPEIADLIVERYMLKQFDKALNKVEFEREGISSIWNAVDAVTDYNAWAEFVNARPDCTEYFYELKTKDNKVWVTRPNEKEEDEKKE